MVVLSEFEVVRYNSGADLCSVIFVVIEYLHSFCVLVISVS